MKIIYRTINFLVETIGDLEYHCDLREEIKG